MCRHHLYLFFGTPLRKAANIYKHYSQAQVLKHDILQLDTCTYIGILSPCKASIFSNTTLLSANTMNCIFSQHSVTIKKKYQTFLKTTILQHLGFNIIIFVNKVTFYHFWTQSLKPSILNKIHLPSSPKFYHYNFSKHDTVREAKSGTYHVRAVRRATGGAREAARYLPRQAPRRLIIKNKI